MPKRGERRGPYKLKAEKSVYYPYVQPDQDSDLLSRVVKSVPKSYPEAMRADICQAVCLRILEQPGIDIQEAIKIETRQFRRHESTADRSLDEPCSGHIHPGDFNQRDTLKDRISTLPIPKKIGRKRNGRTIVKRTCVSCGLPFYRNKDGDGQQYCSKRCKMTVQMADTKKLPSADEIRRLYSDLGWSTYRIARQFGCTDSGVRHAMDKAGIRRRKKGEPRVFQQCKESGCDKPAFKGLQSGTAYCKWHYKIHRSEWNRERLKLIRALRV